MKYVRVAIAVAVIGISILLAMPGLLTSATVDENAAADSTATVAPAPTPNYNEIAPAVTAAPVSLDLGGANATAAPEDTSIATDNEGPAYVLDLWMDASPNIAGVSPFDSDFRKGTEYGQWLGGYFYAGNPQGMNKSDDEFVQEGWMPSLLNLLYGKEVAGLGSVRVLRMSAENMLSKDTLTSLQEQYPDADMSALVRDTLTYHVIRNNSENHYSFFRGLIRTGGLMDAGAGNPYSLKDCFFYPNNAKYTNRTVADKNNTGKGADSNCDWQRETTDNALLSAADRLVDSAVQSYNAGLSNQFSSSLESPEANDYLYYALSNMDPSRLNVVVVDTLGLPEVDQHTALYTQRFEEMVAQNNGDLSVGVFAFQLDYAGKISSVGGRMFDNGFLWGFENLYKYQSGNTTRFKWGFVQPMPKPVMMLVIGPKDQVNNYSTVLCEHIDREMQEGRSLSGERGNPLGSVDSSYEPFDSFKFRGYSFTSPVFTFQYKHTVMGYMDVVAEQSTLMDAISARLADSDTGLFFSSEGLELETQQYDYDTTLPNSTNETIEAVPVVTSSFYAPLALSLDLQLEEEEAHNVTGDQYDATITVSAALLTRSFALEEIAAMSASGELDVSANSEILSHQAYIGSDNRIYKYEYTETPDLTFMVSDPMITEGKLQLLLATETVPTPGYYWVTLQMSSKALAELDNNNWNAIESWMQADNVGLYNEDSNPAVLDDEHSWDFTPSTSLLNGYASTDDRLSGGANAIAYATKSSFLHHAWGASGISGNRNSTASGFPAEIPPVFRLFQFNRITSGIRDGLLDREGAIDSTPFLTRHFIICVPETTAAGDM